MLSQLAQAEIYIIWFFFNRLQIDFYCIFFGTAKIVQVYASHMRTKIRWRASVEAVTQHADATVIFKSVSTAKLSCCKFLSLSLPNNRAKHLEQLCLLQLLHRIQSRDWFSGFRRETKTSVGMRSIDGEWRKRRRGHHAFISWRA